MKKILCFILLLCLWGAMVGCSSEPVSFSDKLMVGRKCYVDVVEVIPYSSVDSIYDLYCKCILSNGESIWMEIDPDDYVEYFDAEAISYDIHFTARSVKYDEPVRLSGKVIRDKMALEATSDKEETVKAFRFEAADKEQTLQAVTRSDASIKYEPGMREDVHVYTDILKIQPQYKVSYIGSTLASGAVCKCTTVDGNEIWVLISVDDYKEYFSALIFSESLPGISSSAGTDYIEYALPARLYGMTVKSEDEFNYHGSEISATVFEFRSADKQQLHDAKLINQPEIAYTGNEKKDQPVYVDITAVEPKYTISSWQYTFLKDYVCSCTTTDGRKVWIVMSKTEYEEEFLNEDGTEKTFPNGLRVNGVIVIADDLALDLSSSIGQDKLIEFSEIAK